MVILIVFLRVCLPFVALRTCSQCKYQMRLNINETYFMTHLSPYGLREQHIVHVVDVSETPSNRLLNKQILEIRFF